MFKKLTYRQLNLLIGAGTLLSLLICYLFAFSNTIDQYQQNTTFSQAIDNSQHLVKEVNTNQALLHNIETELGNYEIDSTHNQEFLMGVVSEFCSEHKLTIRLLPDETVQAYTDFDILTTQLQVEGNYTDLLKLISFLEREQVIGKLNSITYEKIKDRKTKKVILVANILLQNIRFH